MSDERVVLNGAVKGDTIKFECALELEETLANFKIRAELYDKCGNCLKVGTLNVSGGADSQIEVTNAVAGEFTIKFPTDKTDCFDDQSMLEIEIQHVTTEEKTTVLPGNKTCVNLIVQQIDWDEVS
jgi:ABC-type phosphate transport system ATPase subunit